MRSAPRIGSPEPVVILGPDDHHRSRDVVDTIALLRAVRSNFPDGEQLVTVPAPGAIEGRHVLIVQTTAPPQDVRLMTACQLVAVAAAAGAASITCFLPYLCYQRQDRVTRAGQALTARLVLMMLRGAGASTVLTVDRHSSPAWDGQPGLPEVVSLSSAEPVAAALAARFDYVVAADRGSAPRVARLAETLGVPPLVLSKRKSPTRGTFYPALPEQLRDRRVLVVDDVCTSGSTIRPLCAGLAAMGARLTVSITHLVPTANGRVTALDGVQRLISSDSCGDPAAAVRLMPLALEHWRRTVQPGAASRTGSTGAAAGRARKTR